MTQNEMYAAFAVVALVAYQLGLKKAQQVRAVAAPYDPLAWLNSYQTV
jgi:hypothetical protein